MPPTKVGIGSVAGRCCGQRQVGTGHRKLLGKFGRAHGDPLVQDLLADDVGPRPFQGKEGGK